MNSYKSKNHLLPRSAALIFLLVLLTYSLSACASDSEPQTAQPAAENGIKPAADPAEILPTTTPEADEVATASTPQVASLSEIQLRLEPIVQNLRKPTFVTHAGDNSGRLFILEQAGTIHIWQDGRILDEPFLDIESQVGSSNSEQGLLSIAFAPNFVDSGHFFVNYTNTDGDTVVARYTVSESDPNKYDPASEQRVLFVRQPASNHNGGMMAFGPDGNLYIGMGDGGGAFDRYQNGQNPETLLGSMVRIDVTTDQNAPYTIPADNPWVGDTGMDANALDEIWAKGLRNPWRFSFDRQTGDLWIADVGQNQYEEVNLTRAETEGGLNYGWPIQEASHCLEEGCNTEGLVQPVIEYGHEGHCSVTGGYVYRGDAIPGLDGVYLFGDYCSGTIWGARMDDSGTWTSEPLHQMQGRLSSFGEGEDSELYAIDHGGTIYQIVPATQSNIWLPKTNKLQEIGYARNGMYADIEQVNW